MELNGKLTETMKNEVDKIVIQGVLLWEITEEQLKDNSYLYDYIYEKLS